MKKFVGIPLAAIFLAMLFLTTSPAEANITCTVSVNGAIFDLAAENIKQDSLDLTWTTPDIKSLRSGHLEVRLSNTEIIPENWNQAVEVSGEPRPKPGRRQKMKITGLEPSTTYYLAAKITGVVDVGLPISNVVKVATLKEKDHPGHKYREYGQRVQQLLWSRWPGHRGD